MAIDVNNKFVKGAHWLVCFQNAEGPAAVQELACSIFGCGKRHAPDQDMNKSILPTSRKVLSTFQTYIQLGSSLPILELIVPSFKFRP